MRCPRWLPVFLAIAFCVSVSAQGTIPAAKLDSYFDALAKHGLANGNIAISEKGVLRYQRPVGFATFAPADPSTTSTRYRIGSVSQLFTAILTMQFVEGARITLDNKVAEFFPELPNALETTYRDLLRSPGDNYLLLGRMIEKVDEKPYAEVVDRQIAAPLGLVRTYFVDTGPKKFESTSYALVANSWIAQPATDAMLLGGARGMVSTPADLVRILDAVFEGKLVSLHSLATMSDVSSGAGLGLWPYELAGESGRGQCGGVEGFRACAIHFPARSISIAYATNAPVLPMSEIVDEVLRTIFIRGHVPPTFDPRTLSTRDQTAYAGIWRSAPGASADLPFREVRAPGTGSEIVVTAGIDAPVARINGRDVQLVAIGPDELRAADFSAFLRFYPRRDELVVRGADGAVYFRRVD